MAIFMAAAMMLLAGPALAREPAKPKSANAEAQKLIDQAWAALDQDMTTANIDAAIAKLEAAQKLDATNDGLLIELADECFMRGYLMPDGNDAEITARNAFFQKGYDTAEAAFKIKESVGAHGWMAANLGALKQHDNPISQAGILPEIKKHLDWIAKTDKAYKYGLVTRFWVGMLSRAPAALLKLLGQNPDQILADLDQLMAKHPGYLENFLYKAELYQSMGKTAEAKELLDRVIKADPNAMPAELAYNRFVQKTARAYWKKWTGKDYPQP
jgi:tetratricopeptide (TPR) repeat protein